MIGTRPIRTLNYKKPGLRIALLEDDEHLAKLICLWIEEEGHHCTIFADGRQMLNALKADSFDLLLLDWMVPDPRLTSPYL